MFALYDGNIYSYQSHENWPLNPFEIGGGTALPDDQKLPGHFATIKFTRDSRQGSDSGSSTTTKSENSDESVNAGMERHHTYLARSGPMNNTGCETPPGSRATTPPSSSFKLALTPSSTASTPTPSILPMRVAETIKTVGYVKHERLLQSLHAHTFRRGEEDRQESRNV
ncbi:hypothetical protein CABS03_01679 [Colletotrichum abscissum]